MNEKQRDGMERAGETGDIIDRRAGERRAAAPVVAVVAAENTNCTVEGGDVQGNSVTVSMDSRPSTHLWTMGSRAYLAESALASQAQAAPVGPIKRYEPTDRNQHYADFPPGPMSEAVKGEYVLYADHVAMMGQAAVSAPVDERAAFEAWYCKEYTGFVPRSPNGDYANFDTQAIWHAWQQRAGLAAQAAVGVASQQEQLQPSCMPPTRGTGGQLDASVSALTPARIYDIAASCDIGIGDDDQDTAMRVDFARAIESELTRRFRAPGGNTNDKASPDLASIASQAQGDPLDTLLPCNITVGQTTYAKGIVLRSLVNHAQQLYTAANSRVDPKQLLANVAGWYAEKGYLLDEDDVPAAIRALCPTPTES